MKQFTRMNFYKGLVTSAEDWQMEQAYHIEKRKLHLRGLHHPGIVPGEGSELRVDPAPDGGCTVQPGYAVDSAGHDLYLIHPEKVHPPEKSYKGDSYIYISFAENYDSARKYESYEGYARTVEEPKVSWETEKNTDGLKIELARFDHKQPQLKPNTQHRTYIRARLRGAFRSWQPNNLTLDGNETTSFDFDQFDDVDEAADAVYLVNVFPLPSASYTAGRNAQVDWRIESTADDKSIRYRIHVTNRSDQKGVFRCVIQRVNLKALL
ncbi:MAG TPA: hypothetical protein VK961_12995 [Chthoniobacter sp.]|nr:hypothetical protein [Chthoniobacter sp.]